MSQNLVINIRWCRRYDDADGEPERLIPHREREGAVHAWRTAPSLCRAWVRKEEDSVDVRGQLAGILVVVSLAHLDDHAIRVGQPDGAPAGDHLVELQRSEGHGH